MQKVKIVVFVGMPGAGKSTCVDHLTALGLPKVYFGGIVVDETQRRYGEVSEALEKVVREDLRATEGKGAIANRIIIQLDALIADGRQHIIADGLYSWTEYKIFKDRYGNDAVIIAITAPRHVRHERLARRPIRPLTDTEVTTREYAEIENIEKGGPIANADYTLVNNTTPENLIAQLDATLVDIDFAA
jgi:dephospho-CoA kinase